MRTIKGWDDVAYIIKHKLDVIDSQGHKMDFVRFVNMSLMDVIIHAFLVYTYDPN